MQAVWDKGRCAVEGVHEIVSRKHKMKETSVRTILRRLEQKGYLRHEEEGRAYVYLPAEPPASVAARAVRQIIDSVCRGSMEELVSGMVEAKVLSKRELDGLENFVKRYVILEDDEGSLRELVEMSSTRQRTSPREEPTPPKEQGLKALVRGLKDEAEMEAIADALEKTRWCRKDAAKMLGISYKALLYKMRQFNLDTPRTRKVASTTAV